MTNTERNPVLLALEQSLRSGPVQGSDAAVTQRTVRGFTHEACLLSSFDSAAVHAAAAALLLGSEAWRIVERMQMGTTYHLELHRPLPVAAHDVAEAAAA